MSPSVLDGNPKAVWFRNVGPEKTELVGNVMGAREPARRRARHRREANFRPCCASACDRPFKPIDVPSSAAPVHEVVQTGEEADLTTLPVHLQHGLDGAPYISASIDYAQDRKTGFTNLGCRRMMLRGPRAAGIDLVAPSDLKAIYLAAVAKGERLPVAFTVGSYPTDFLAAVASTPPMDEFEVVGAVRGAPLPVVKCKTIDVKVPADAEMVLEGYLDERGHVEPEGPYGEYIGYYGLLKSNPVFHLTAITRRKDALFQTLSIGGARLGYTDTAQLGAAKTEAAIWSVLQQAIREPVAVCCTASSRRHVQRAGVAAAAQSGRGPQRHRGGVLLARATSSTCSWSTMISTCSPTSRSIGRWQPASRPIAISLWPRASAACRSTLRCKAAAPEPRAASTARNPLERATASSSPYRTHRNCRSASAARWKPCWRRAQPLISI